jgi:hypothetical protein
VIPPLRGPTRHNAARKKKSGRSGRDDNIRIEDEERNNPSPRQNAEPGAPAARKKKSGRSGRDDKFGIEDEERERDVVGPYGDV